MIEVGKGLYFSHWRAGCWLDVGHGGDGERMESLYQVMILSICVWQAGLKDNRNRKTVVEGKREKGERSRVRKCLSQRS